MSYFDDEKNYVGVLTTRLAKETSLVQGATGIRVKAALEAVVGLSIGLGIALVFGWQLALLLLAAFPLIGIAGGMQAKFAQGFSVKESEDAEQGGKVRFERGNYQKRVLIIDELEAQLKFNGELLKMNLLS